VLSEGQLFSLDPLIADAKERTLYYQHTATEQSGFLVPFRGQRGNVILANATYKDGDKEVKGRSTRLQLIVTESRD
jgi:hypothetical protein